MREFVVALQLAALCVLLLGCAHGAGKRPGDCGALASQVLPADAAGLHDAIVRIRLHDPEDLSDCRPRGICIESCEEGTACFTCERLLTEALGQLAAIETDEAARLAAALVLDRRLGWDAGLALTLAWSVTRMQERVLPYLRPHVAESRLARTIVDCIEQGKPCM